MQLDERDLSYLIDILDCIFDIEEFTGKIEFDEFKIDKMRKLAVERQLEVIGQEECFVAAYLENNITSQGKTVNDAFENLKEAIALYYED